MEQPPVGPVDDESAQPPANAEPAGPRIQVSTLRRAVLRALLAGAAGAGLCAVLAFVFSVPYGVGFLAIMGFFGGGILGIVGLVEAVAWGTAPRPDTLLTPPTPQRAASWRRVVAVSCGIWILSAVLVWGALLQSVYLSGVIEGYGNVESLGFVQREMLHTLNDPNPMLAILVLVGAVFALASLARGCGLRVPEAIALSLAGAVLPAAAVLFGTTLCEDMIDARFVFGTVVAGGALLPFMGWLGDAVERRFTGEEPVVWLRERRVAWGCAAALLVVYLPGAYALASNRQRSRELYQGQLAEFWQAVGQDFRDEDLDSVFRRCREVQTLDLGYLDALRVREAWFEAAWFAGALGPEKLSVEEQAQIDIWDGDAWLRFKRAELRVRTRGDLEGALEDLAVAAGGAPASEVHLLRAEVFALRGDVDGATAELGAAVQAGARRERLERVRGLLAR